MHLRGLTFVLLFVDLPFAECMRNLLVAVEEEDLRGLLERSLENAMDVGTLADQESLGEW